MVGLREQARWSHPTGAALVFEVAAGGEDHGDAVLVGGGDGFFVADTAAGLNDGGDAGRGGSVNRVREGEEGVGGENRALRAVTRFLDCDFYRIDSAHLAGTATDERVVLGEYDGVAFYVA